MNAGTVTDPVRQSIEVKAALDRVAFLMEKPLRFGMIADADLRGAVQLMRWSESQLNQDYFVLSQLGWKREGFFVEFGATDGRTLSNSWMLEKVFGWTGILAEPGLCWREALGTSGRSAAIEYDCVWTETGAELSFRETGYAELSTLGAFSASDRHDRSTGRDYTVRTISLNDMLAKHNAPAMMDYLSIDTEGSELDILRSLDWSRYRFRTITCEHNWTDKREEIHALLSDQGYQRRFEDISQFDDWYVLAQ